MVLPGANSSDKGVGHAAGQPATALTSPSISQSEPAASDPTPATITAAAVNSLVPWDDPEATRAWDKAAKTAQPGPELAPVAPAPGAKVTLQGLLELLTRQLPAASTSEPAYEGTEKGRSRSLVQLTTKTAQGKGMFGADLFNNGNGPVVPRMLASTASCWRPEIG